MIVKSPAPRYSTQVYADMSAQVDAFTAFIAEPLDGDYLLGLKMPFSGIITSLTAKTTSGTGTATIKIDSTPVTSLSTQPISSTENEYLATGANSFSIGQDIHLTIASLAVMLGLSVTVTFRRNASGVSTLVLTESGNNSLDGDLNVTGNVTATGIIAATTFQGDGSGLTGISTVTSYNDLTDIPSTFAPSAHSHPAGDIVSGVLATARLGTGTANSSTFLRGDNTWQANAVGDALTSNPLSQFAATTSAQLAGVLSDDTGFSTGAQSVFNINPVILYPTSAMSALVIDITLKNQTKSISAPATFTLSGTPANGQQFGWRVTTDSTARVITLPAGTWKSESRNGSTVTTLTIPASSTVSLLVEYEGSSTYRIYNEQLTINDLTLKGTPIGADSVSIYDSVAGADAKATITSLAAAIGSSDIDDTAYDATSWNGVTTIAPSKNAVRDKIEALQPLDSDLTSWAAITRASGFDTFATTPSSANLAAAVTDETGSGALVFGTAPTITGGATTALTNLSIRSTGSGAFNLRFANSENLTASRILTLTTNDAARTINLGGDITTGGAFVTSGASSLTLVTSGSTSVTLPTTGTLATTGDLSQFAATTSAQLAGIISNETGSGALVFATSPTLVTPVLGAATATSYALTNGGIITDGGTGAITLTASGTNQNITITPSGTGKVTTPAAIVSSGKGFSIGDIFTATFQATGSNDIYLDTATSARNIIFSCSSTSSNSTSITTSSGGAGGIRFNNQATIAWTSSSTDPTGTKDTGLGRNAAGVVEVSNGTAGTYRDIKVRSVLAGDATKTIQATATNDSAAAGFVGEYSSSLIASGSAVSLTTATPANVTSLSLTAGDWDVAGNVNFTETVATATARSASIGITSATLATDGSEVTCGVQSTLVSEVNSITIPRKRISISGTTTVYLVGSATFSAGTVAGYGALTARRLR